jgi:hypothetical protein
MMNKRVEIRKQPFLLASLRITWIDGNTILSGMQAALGPHQQKQALPDQWVRHWSHRALMRYN